MMKKVFAVLFAVMVPLIFAKVVLSEGLSIKPGKWEYKTTINMSMMPNPKVTTKTECITAEEANNDPLAAMVEDGKCKVLNKEVSGNSIEFEVECDGGMGGNKMIGKGYFTTQGTTSSGKMEMTMDMPQMGGKSMKMNMEWEGKRTGKCD